MQRAMVRDAAGPLTPAFLGGCGVVMLGKVVTAVEAAAGGSFKVLQGLTSPSWTATAR